MTRIPAALLAVALAAQTGCGGLSQNQSRGMMYAGGAAVFMGSIIAIDGMTCQDIAGGDQACDEDKSDLYGGVAVMGVGLLIGAIGYLLRPEAHAEAAIDAPAPAPLVTTTPPSAPAATPATPAE